MGWTERKTNKLDRERIGVKEKDGIVEQMKRERRQNIWIGNGKRKVVMVSIEGERMGWGNKRGRAWVDNNREWFWRNVNGSQ